MGVNPFIQKWDATGKKGIHPLVKLVSCFRIIAYGDSYDREDENLRLSKTSLRNIYRSFCKLILIHFGDEYLNRAPTEKESISLLKINKRRGFPGLLASWDCSHFEWHKCPIQLHGQFKNGKYKGKTVVLEAVVDCHLRIWYCHFGFPGTLNDINILGRSNIVNGILTGSFNLKTPEKYNVNGTTRDYFYFLVDGIYPAWSIFVTTIKNPLNEKEKAFSKQQEAVRKDVERVFAVLTLKFQILARPFRLWELSDINIVMQTCVIIHNMQVEERISSIGEDEHYNDLKKNQEQTNIANDTIPHILTNDDDLIYDNHQYETNIKYEIAKRVSYMNEHLHDTRKHNELTMDLVEHIYNNKDKIFKFH